MRTISLVPELFDATAMQAVTKDLMAMTVVELREELAAREEPVSGNKAWLRRRLHATTIVRDYNTSARRFEAVLLAFSAAAFGGYLVAARRQKFLLGNPVPIPW